MSFTKSNVDFFYAHQRNVGELTRRHSELEQSGRKALSDREKFTLSLMKYLKSLRDEYPGLIQGDDDQMFVLAGRCAAVLLGGM